MIVSHELSMIQMNEPLRAQLAANIEAFLSIGGTIQELPGFGIVHRPPNYNRSMQHPPDFQSTEIRNETREQVQRIKEYGKTMTRDQVCEKEGISRRVLLGIAKRHSIKFVSAMGNGGKATKAKNSPPERELMLVAKIRDCLSQNMSRKRCYETIHISSTLFHRLIKDYKINYPTLQSAFR